MDIVYTPGASNVNYLTATYAQLVAAFGDGTLEPRDTSKCKAQWRIQTVHGEVDLYDYCDGRKLRDITEWHVQGPAKAVWVMLARLRAAVLDMPDERVKTEPEPPAIDDFLRGYKDPSSYEDDEDSAAMRVGTAIEIAWKYGSYEGEHHKEWVIDQMVRALVDESDYATFVHLVTHDETGELAYEWSEGIAP